MNDFEMKISMPLDSEGFLRRSCPNCERELKWIVAGSDEDSIPAPDGGYFCPYCGEQGPVDAWWTETQIEAAKAHAYRKVVRPELEKFADSIGSIGNDLISFEASVSDSDMEPPTLTEPNDMRRVDFDCHDEPVKISEDWGEVVHCPICGATEQPDAPGSNDD